MRVRCECSGGDVPHEHTNKSQKRCSRTAVVAIRVVETGDTPGPWYNYCRPCADAITEHQRTKGLKKLESKEAVDGILAD